ncbi:isoprenylcysteine carboxylmethyltransferase family protein [Rhizobiaceae bacterium BDR2-2]|uniref:Isoprenylcysteine carboxylmethyltransferase family protein n=1 Tax=Ectorhizobium quercum TaxID=2965071 RepID=A0AAE3N368_9HYPH|nr:isoprenylcysteine carboxylmethyltransferase family protein [Ectorhizobium quercum]MCX8997742.1 isoprenylcysteine carboxylmethyltransferase family protein [Ectorhizobium quercum]
MAGITGTILLCLSLFLVLSAAITLRNGGMTVLPPKAPRHLITRGPFRYTRNPIYLGYIMTLAAFGLLAADAWFFIAAIAAAVVMTFASIHREEIHLLARFGSEFERYCRRTPRWL